MTFAFIVTIPGQEPVLYELNADRIGAGRTADNQVQIDHEYVSSSHFEFRREGDSYLLVDLNSKNGVRVNGESVTEPVELRDGDRILVSETIGAHFLVLAEGEKPESAVEVGSDEDQMSAAAYVSLDQKISALTRKLDSIRGHLEEKQAEYDQLKDTIRQLQQEISHKSSSGANPSEIAAMQKDLMEKTRRVTVLQSDIEDTESRIADLEKTARTPIAPHTQQVVPVPPSGPPSPNLPQKPPGPPLPPSPQKLQPLTGAKPVSPAAPPATPSVAKKPPGIPLPPAAPKKPPGVPKKP